MNDYRSFRSFFFFFFVFLLQLPIVVTTPFYNEKSITRASEESKKTHLLFIHTHTYDSLKWMKMYSRFLMISKLIFDQIIITLQLKMIDDHRVQYLVESPDILVRSYHINICLYCPVLKEYPQVRPTNPLYSSQSTIKTPTIKSKSSAKLVDRRQKFDPQAPRRPSDWRWLAILCIFLFFPLGMLIQQLNIFF